MKERIKALLNELAKTREEFWNISPETGQFLNFFIKDRKIKTVLEIGTSNGYSGIWIAEALTQTDGHLYTIESHRERHDLAKHNFNKAHLSGQITQIRGHAPEKIPEDQKMFDLAFFDATKFEHLDYFETIKTRINKNGFIITDNAISHQGELQKFFEIITKDPNWQCYTLKIGTGLMISLHE